MQAVAGQLEVLEMVANGASLSDVLAAACRALEQQEHGLLCSFVLPDEHGRLTGLAVCAGLPHSFARGLQGLRIESSPIAPCARTLHCGEVVAVPDVNADRRFGQQWRDLLLRHGLAWCRSSPIFGPDRKVLASFVAYRREPEGEAPESRRRMIKLTGIAIARHQADALLLRQEERLGKLTAAFRDVTADWDAEQPLREAERRFRTMADNSPVLIWQTDQHGVTFVNRHYLSFFGRPFEELAGMGWTKFLHPDDSGYLTEYQTAFERRDRHDHHARFRRHDGEYRWLHNVGTTHFGPGGAYLGFIGCSFDVTDSKRAADELMEADRKKDQFLATLAHELRNPLAPIRNGLQIMKVTPDDPGAIATVRAMMERQVVQMARLIDDLMDLSRVNRGNIFLHKTRVKLADAVRDAMDMARPLLDERNHELLLGMPAEPIYLDADHTRLAQMFANILNNAAKYTAKGGRIALKVEQKGGEALVSVEDNGIGIPPHMLTRVFDMFSQIDGSLEKSEGGLGIGLYLAKRLAELHGGSIVAESCGAGTGTRFVVRLPIESAQAGEPRESIPGGPVRPRQRRRILIVDDNRDAADSLAIWLEITGNETLAVHDGFEALEVCAAFKPDVLLLDVGMPKLNGFDTCRRIRREPWGKGIAIVACTGWGQENDRRMSQEAGFDFHMVKPVDPDELERLLAGFPPLALRNAP